MGKLYDTIDAELESWIQRQKVFFVATAPLSPDAHINCSPKGGDTFRIVGSKEVAYLDLTGSGIETVAHVQENGRIVRSRSSAISSLSRKFVKGLRSSSRPGAVQQSAAIADDLKR